MAKKTTEAKAEAKPEAKAGFSIYDKGTLVRVYTIKEHGKNAEDLAKEFAEKKCYEVK